MEWICVPNMTAVNVRKRMASRQRKISSNTDTPGEKLLHSAHRKRLKKRWITMLLLLFLKKKTHNCIYVAHIPISTWFHWGQKKFDV